MENPNAPQVIGDNGLRGRLVTEPGAESAADTPLLVELEDGQEIRVPGNVLVRQSNGSYYVPLGPDDIRGAVTPHRETATRSEAPFVVPVYQEALTIGKRTVETGRARIAKHVTERSEVVDEPLLREDVQIDHVPINRIWVGPPPQPRYEADTMVVPLLEEVLVVEKRLMLREELHIRRVQHTVHDPQTVVLRSESVTVERVEPAAEQNTGGAPRL